MLDSSGELGLGIEGLIPINNGGSGEAEPNCNFVDTFTDTNGTALSDHTPDVGNFAWTQANTATIQDNKASIEPNGFISAELDSPDKWLYFTGIQQDSASGVTFVRFRLDDSNNRYDVELRMNSSEIIIREQVGGTSLDAAMHGFSALSLYDVVVHANGDTVDIEVFEDAVSIYTYQITTAINQLGSWVGIRATADTTTVESFQACTDEDVEE